MIGWLRRLVGKNVNGGQAAGTSVKTLRIHVGFPKSGSTTLQSAFSQTEKLLYLGKQDIAFANEDIRVFCREIAACSDVRLLDVPRYRKAFVSAFKGSHHDVALLSDELFSSVGFNNNDRSLSILQCVENFSYVLDCKIEVVLVVREQQSFLRSYYKQLTHHDLSFNEFLALVLMRKNRWIHPVLDYGKLIKALRPAVSKLHVVPFEALFFDRSKAAGFMRKIGVPDVVDHLYTTHERKQASDEYIAQKFAINREALKRGARIRGMITLDAMESDALKTQNTTESKFLARHLKDLRKRQAQSRAPYKKLTEKKPPLLAEDAMAVDPAMEKVFTAYFKNANHALPELLPEYDWKSLGYVI